jgi:hypothetical protein
VGATATQEAVLSPVEAAKREAAYRAVNQNVQSGMAVGVGSGSTVVYAVDRLAARVASGELRDIVCVPTSFQSRQLIIEHSLSLSDLEMHPQVRAVARERVGKGPRGDCILVCARSLTWPLTEQTKWTST